MNACLCNPDLGRQCEFHARAPRPCPSCVAAGRSDSETGLGFLQRYARKDGQAYQVCANLDRRALSPFLLVPVSTPFWACNVCEEVR